MSLKLLEPSARVLAPETLRIVQRTLEINRFGMSLLDRWALSYPEELKALEMKNLRLLLLLVLEQQKLEEEAFERDESQAKLANGLMPHEVLEIQELLRP